jgi:hypothetical protein
LKYGTDETLLVVDELFEHIQFYQWKLYGVSKEFDLGEYSIELLDGLLPMDMYNKRVDELVKRDLTCDWEWLRWIAKWGEICIICYMPSELSAVANATHRSLITTKIK